MNIPHSILLIADAEGEQGVKGRTLLQKRIYFLAELLNEETGFRAHYYGPFSSDVATDLDRMVMFGFLSEESRMMTAGANPQEGPRFYTYRLTEQGKEVVDSIKNDPANQESMRVIKMLELLGKEDAWNDPNTLIVAAKLLFVQTDTPEALNDEKLVEKAKEYGWKIKKSDMKGAKEFLGKIDSYKSIS